MINKSEASDVKPFTGLSPDVVLDAAASVGLDVDGRLFALNSYENRVYQLGSPGGSLVLKFYRPERWTDEQIGEEHEFTAEMASAELPVAAPVTSEATWCCSYGHAVSRWWCSTICPRDSGRLFSIRRWSSERWAIGIS